MPTDNITYVACTLALLTILAFFFRPFRIIFRGVFRSVLGFISLLLINFAGGYMGVSVGINVVNAVFIGLLGIPGLVALLTVNSILG